MHVVLDRIESIAKTDVRRLDRYAPALQ